MENVYLFADGGVPKKGYNCVNDLMKRRPRRWSRANDSSTKLGKSLAKTVPRNQECPAVAVSRQEETRWTEFTNMKHTNTMLNNATKVPVQVQLVIGNNSRAFDLNLQVTDHKSALQGKV
jgi:hypothetical protein